MGDSTSRDIFGSLFKGLSAGLETYGRAKHAEGVGKAKSAESAAKEAEARRKEAIKTEREYQQQLFELKLVADAGDEEAKRLYEETVKGNEGRKSGERQMFGKATVDRFRNLWSLEDDENEQVYNEMLEQKMGVDPESHEGSMFDAFLEHEGLTPADMGGQSGRAAVTPHVEAMREQYGGLMGPPDIERVLRAGDEAAAEREFGVALTKAKRDKRVKDIVGSPQAPKAKPPVTKLQEKSLIDQVIKDERKKILSNAQEYIYKLQDEDSPAPPANIKSRAGLKAAARWGIKLMKDKPGWWTGDEEAPDSTFQKMLEQYDSLSTSAGRSKLRGTLPMRFPEIYGEDALTTDEESELEELLRKAGK